ncbi:ubiquitin-conjugating enzyme/RWD-like protein [Dioszegia hungarica]|uniref:E2 ubiquitin-conjugating enzyme n=1 Tax=Dioszegia hungarica TaxID=4972 RepID=A0AA38H1H3_9TREE|nr:ubiquitin-conjugating enzyme/RWD-like protein [Dioszegia hungarica]KAI9631970.1 ubiquitin-conjugating enzyme/RWD-like protein [Dioszegia hungarica]
MPPSNATASKRIKKEIADLAKESLGDITLTPNESNIFMWRATLPGPQGSPYEGGIFEVDIRIPENYPFAPPQIQFVTKVYHCNVNAHGGICLDLLKNAWSPALSLYKVILSLSSLLTDPNPADPLVPQIAQELRRNKKKHDDTAREWVRLYAKPAKPVTAPAAPKQTPFERAASSRTALSANSSRARNGNSVSSVSPVPPPAQIAGTRRTHSQANGTAPAAGSSGSNTSHAIILADDSDDEGIEALSDAGSDIEVLGTGGGSRASGNGHRKANGGREGHRAKKARGDEGGAGSGRGGAGGGDDVIVVDD